MAEVIVVGSNTYHRLENRIIEKMIAVLTQSAKPEDHNNVEKSEPLTSQSTNRICLKI